MKGSLKAEVAAAGVAFDRHGSGGPLLVLLHGLGATAAIWQPLIDVARERWDGSVLAVDLPGHGGSAHSPGYAPVDQAARLAPVVADHAGGNPVTLLGHSLGGVVALALAGPRGAPRIEGVFGLGIKVRWADAELERFAALAMRPRRRFATETEALAQHRRMCGLADAAPHLLRRGVRATDGEWELALDPAALAVAAPAMAALVAAATCPVHLARGEHDPMVDDASLGAFDNDPVSIAGAGHNAMIDAPAAVWAWLARSRRAG